MLANLESNVARGSTIFDRIFVPIDYSMSSHRALGAALDLLDRHGSEVCLFHAVEGVPSDEWLGGIGSPAVGGDWVLEGEARLRRFIENVAPGMSQRLEVMARVGEPLRILRGAAHAWGATLIIAPATVHAQIVRSTAEKLVREAEIPVLILPTVDGKW